ncbi:MAG: AMP-binding protein, partial [Nitriliruptoraceae bacterium]
TGAPRGVVLSHRALTASTTRSLVALGAATGEMFALVLPLHHIAGLQVVLRAWSCDTTPVVTDLGELAAGSAERVHVSFVAAQLAELLDRGVHPERFAKVLVGGGPVPDRLLTRARAAGLDVVTSYGMTETCGGCVYDGRPLPDIAVDAREGRLRIRGPVLADSYLDDPTPLRDTDGWFVTPDRGAVVDGRVIVHGRTDDVIVTGGENVDAILVADALRAHHAVRDAAVVGIDDARWGAIIAAAIVPTPGAHCDPESVVAFVRRQLPASHAPRRVVVVDALPVTTLDKVDRNAVRRLFDDRSDAVT